MAKPNTYESFIIKHRYWFIIVPVVLTLLAAIPLANTKINPDLEKYLPRTSPAMLNKAVLDSLFGNTDPVILIFETDDVLNNATLIRMKKLSKAFQQAGEFDDVISIFDSKNIKSEYGTMIVEPAIKNIPKNESMREALRQEIKNNELVYQLVVSEDFRKTAIILKVASGTSDEEIITAIDEILEKIPGNEKVYQGGTPYLRVQVNDDISRDMFILMPLGLLIMIIFLFVSFREFRGVTLPLMVVTMSIIISLGFFPLMGWELSIITILAPIMMIAIANNYGVHFIARYQEMNAKHHGLTMRQITTNALYHLKKPVIITGLTTIAGVLGLVVHVLLPARQLGAAAALGIGFALLLSISFIPAMMANQKKGNALKSFTTEKKGIIDKALRLAADTATNRPTLVLILFGSFLVFSGVGITFLKADANSENFLPPGHPFRQATAIVNEDFGGTKYLSLLFEGDIKSPELLTRLDRYETALESNPAVGSVTSIASMIRLMSRSLNDTGDPLYDTIPDMRAAVAQYLELYHMSGDPEDFEAFVNFDYTQALMIVQFRADGRQALDEAIHDIKAITLNDPNLILSGGYCMVDLELADAIITGQYNSLIFAIVIIAVLVMIIFRSVSAGLVGSLPLVYTIIALFGTMGWLGIKLDIATAMLSSIAIGIGIDYTVHFFWRYQHELGSGKSYTQAIVTTHATTGRGIVINAFSVMFGFTILFVSSFLTIKYFAFLIIFSVLLCLLCALILVPSICLMMKPKFLKQSNPKNID